MLSRDSSDQHIWLFPECFQFVLDRQLDDGGWCSYASEIDGILNTAASLLSLKTHMNRSSYNENSTKDDLEGRITRALNALQTQLNAWDVNATEHVGFEILVPALLRLLGKEGFIFEFPGEGSLRKINEKKMSRFDLNTLHYTENISILHSLEAFADMIDCSQFACRKTNGSIMASPSATAAYLIFSSCWDDEAEAYLRHVVTRTFDTADRGGVPSAFPSTHFELAWVLSTLLEASFSIEDLGVDRVEQIQNILASGLEVGQGIAGFALAVVPDADDTARILLAMRSVGKAASAEKLVHTFEADAHFKTYTCERNASFTTNCNVLIALLLEGNILSYVSQIEKATRFLCSSWWNSSDGIKDKWHLSSSYPTMLFTQALLHLLKLWDDGLLSSLPVDLTERIPVILCQILIRTLKSQNSDGSWGPTQEETAHSVLTLARLSSITFPDPLQLRIMSAVESGREYLRSCHGKPEYLWIEKVTYYLDTLSEGYCLAALNISTPPLHLSYKIGAMFAVPMEKITKFTKFYSQLPLFKGSAQWKIQAFLIEGHLFQPLLRQVRLDIFPRKGMEEDKYFEYIPSTWTGCNNLNGTFVSNSLLYEMMVVSFLNYQADEYMETVGMSYSHDLRALKNCVESLFIQSDPTDSCKTGILQSNGTAQKNPDTQSNGSNGTTSPNSYTYSEINGTTGDVKSHSSPINEVSYTLKRFVAHILHHPLISQASTYHKSLLRAELCTFLLAHITQAEDNARLTTQEQSPQNFSIPFATPRGTYYDWARTTSAAHTSCPYSFAFLTCLLDSSNSHTPAFPTSTEKYLSQDLCRHLATMCRMYNDYGSLARDRTERNVNSVNFPEFGADGATVSDDVLKERLWALMEYERECLGLAVGRLEGLARSGGGKRGRKVVEAVKMFCDVTDFYGQIYVVRDIASRMGGGAG